MAHHVALPSRVLVDLIDNTSDAVIVTSAHDLEAPGPSILYVNPAFTEISGYTADEAIGASPRILQGPGTDRAALARIRAALRAGQPCREEILNYRKDGAPYWLDVQIVPLSGRRGRVEYFGAIERDVTRQRRHAERLARLANEDTLTGLANRPALEARLAELLDQPRGARGHALVMLDLDGFKQVNDRLGHAAGDALLRRFAAVLVSSVRRDDFIARLGGDEFVLALPDARPPDARGVAARIVRATAQLLSTEAGSPAVGVSAGVAPFAPGDSPAEVMERADAALYAAKADGKGRVRVARPALAA